MHWLRPGSPSSSRSRRACPPMLSGPGLTHLRRSASSADPVRRTRRSSLGTDHRKGPIAAHDRDGGHVEKFGPSHAIACP